MHRAAIMAHRLVQSGGDGMKRIGMFLVAVLTVVELAGCHEDKEDTGGVVWATDDGGKPPASENPGITGTPSPSSAPPPPVTGQSQEVTIAKCLSSKGAVLYGASWCSYTQKQIESFKDGFKYLKYVECTEQGAICKAKGISGYPTWIIDGSRIPGYRAPTEVGFAAGCSW